MKALHNINLAMELSPRIIQNMWHHYKRHSYKHFVIYIVPRHHGGTMDCYYDRYKSRGGELCSMNHLEVDAYDDGPVPRDFLSKIITWEFN